MEARIFRAAILAGVIVACCGAGYRTQNFIIEAPTPQLAAEFGKAAEKFRKDLAIEWLGKEMPRWREPCPIRCTVGDEVGAGGATTFVFDQDRSGQPQVFGWQMSVQGSRERILDSVLPHEVTHTIFATHFRRPLPRWADEGGATTVEYVGERAKQHSMLITFLKTSRGIPFDKMFAMREYPSDIMPLYAQGYATARFLIAQGGKQEFVKFIESGFEREDWPAAVEKHYGYASLADLQTAWLGWIRAGGSNDVPAQFAGRKSTPASPASSSLASTSDNSRNRPESNLVAHDDAQPVTLVAAAAPRSTPQANVSPPEHSQVAQDASEGGHAGSSGGWYARQATQRPVDKQRARDAQASASRAAAHPQPVEPAREILLEWNRQPNE
jgi:hypothetical protein